MDSLEALSDWIAGANWCLVWVKQDSWITIISDRIGPTCVYSGACAMPRFECRAEMLGGRLIYRFGDYQIDTDVFELTRGAEGVKVEPIVDVTQIALAGIAAWGAILVTLFRIAKKAR